MMQRAVITALLLQALMLAIPLTALPEEPAPLPKTWEPAALAEEDEPQPEAQTQEESQTPEEGQTQEQPPAAKEPEAAPQQAQQEPQPALPEQVKVLLSDGTVEEMALEEYLWGVVAAEMPAAFQPEALKAQAVAARSYTRWQMAHPDGRHPQAQVCTDYACCQAWMSREERLELWPEDSREEYAERITRAVQETAGETLDYQGECALTVFHASSAGQTRSARQVWGQDIPYLVSVDSPEGEEDAPNYYSVVTVTQEDFRSAIASACPEAVLGEDASQWVVREEGTDKLTVGGADISAQKLRELFGLRSASFTVECTGESVTFYVTGYGHGVGMSQYGANVMAKNGSSYQDILAHYYPGTTLEKA